VTTSFWVYFNSSGLPGGTPWNVTLGNTTETNVTNSIRFLVTNATYLFTVASKGYLPTPSHGLVVANGPASVSAPIRISFRPFVAPSIASYPVSFTAGGLPAEASWQVSIGPTAASGAARTHVLNESNGTYGFAIAPVPGFVTNWSGTAVVRGMPLLVVVDFRPYLNSVAFRESGLPTGSSWNVSIGSSTNSSQGDLLTFALPNGSYSYSVGGPGGFAPPPDGSVQPNGSGPLVLALDFGSVHPSATTVFGLPPWEAVGIAAIVPVALLLAGLLAPTGRGARPRAAEGPAPEPSPESEESGVTERGDDLYGSPPPE
jgi:hypothetical protein